MNVSISLVVDILLTLAVSSKSSTHRLSCFHLRLERCDQTIILIYSPLRQMYNEPKYFYAFLNDTRRLKSRQVNPKKKSNENETNFKNEQKQKLLKRKILGHDTYNNGIQ